MEPNQPYQPAPSGIDYLYQIAPPPQPSGPSKKAKIIMGIMVFVGVALLGLILFLATTQSSDTGPSPIKIAARLQKMQTISQTYTKKLHGTEIQDANSSLGAVLATANQSIAAPLTAYGIDAKKQAKAIADLDPSDELITELNDAYLNAQLDDIYAREMYFMIEDTMVMINSVYKQTKVDDMKEFLKKTYEDFTTLKKRFGALTGATETVTSEEETAS